jgi:hypothetical protein
MPVCIRGVEAARVLGILAGNIGARQQEEQHDRPRSLSREMFQRTLGALTMRHEDLGRATSTPRRTGVRDRN